MEFGNLYPTKDCPPPPDAGAAATRYSASMLIGMASPGRSHAAWASASALPTWRARLLTMCPTRTPRSRLAGDGRPLPVLCRLGAKRRGQPMRSQLSSAASTRVSRLSDPFVAWCVSSPWRCAKAVSEWPVISAFIGRFVSVLVIARLCEFQGRAFEHVCLPHVKILALSYA